MKKRIIAMIASLAVACLVLVGCGGASADNKAAFIGTWELSGMVQGGEEMSADDLQTLKDMGLVVSLILSEDGKGALDLFGEATEGTWEATAADKGSFTADGQTVAMTLSGDTLSMEQDGTQMTFTKGAAAAATSDSANTEATSVAAADEAASTEATDEATEAGATEEDTSAAAE